MLNLSFSLVTLKTDHLEGLLKPAWRKQLWFMLIICLHRFVSPISSKIAYCQTQILSETLMTSMHIRFHILSNSCIFTMQKNYIREETIERMRLDEEVLMDFFREHLSVTVSICPLLFLLSSLFCNSLYLLHLSC